MPSAAASPASPPRVDCRDNAVGETSALLVSSPSRAGGVSPTFSSLLCGGGDAELIGGCGSDDLSLSYSDDFLSYSNDEDDEENDDGFSNGWDRDDCGDVYSRGALDVSHAFDGGPRLPAAPPPRFPRPNPPSRRSRGGEAEHAARDERSRRAAVTPSPTPPCGLIDAIDERRLVVAVAHVVASGFDNDGCGTNDDCGENDDCGLGGRSQQQRRPLAPHRPAPDGITPRLPPNQYRHVHHVSSDESDAAASARAAQAGPSFPPGRNGAAGASFPAAEHVRGRDGGDGSRDYHGGVPRFSSPPRGYGSKNSQSRRRRRKGRLKEAETKEAAVALVRGVEQRLPEDGPPREVDAEEGQGSWCGGGGGGLDGQFGRAFLAQLLLVFLAAAAFGPGALRCKIRDGHICYGAGAGGDPFTALRTGDDDFPDYDYGAGGISPGAGISRIDYVNVIKIACVGAGYASLCAPLALSFASVLPRQFLRAALVSSVAACAAWTALGIAFLFRGPKEEDDGEFGDDDDEEFFEEIFGPVALRKCITALGAAALVATSVRAARVGRRVPLAATNLGAALGAARDAPDVLTVGAMALVATFLWTMGWLCAFVGAVNVLGDEGIGGGWIVAVVTFFFFSYYWTVRVIMGVAQTTVAGIIGRWWTDPSDAVGLCSPAARRSLRRSLDSQSFGSVCLGGLLVGPCVALCRLCGLFRLVRFQLIGRRRREGGGGGEVSRFAVWTRGFGFDFGFGCGGASDANGDDAASQLSPADRGTPPPLRPASLPVDFVVFRHVNQWSFTYIGLYGYPFWESGSRAAQLFEARGWTRAVSNDVIRIGLNMSSAAIGGSTACLCLVAEESDGYHLTSLNTPMRSAFLIGLFVGIFLSSAFLSVVESAANAVLVCHAADPKRKLSRRTREGD